MTHKAAIWVTYSVIDVSAPLLHQFTGIQLNNATDGLQHVAESAQ